MPNFAVTSQSSTAPIFLVNNQNNKNNQVCDVTALLGIFMETTNIKMSLDLGSLYVNINDVVIIFYIMIQNITKSLIVICTFLAVRLRSNCGHAVRCGQLPYDRMRCGAVAVTFLGIQVKDNCLKQQCTKGLHTIMVEK